MLKGKALLARLPEVRGRLTPMRPLSELSWLRVGGPAEVMFQPADANDLAEFLRELPNDIPIYPIGVCSNMIIRDGGLPGVTIKLGRVFGKTEVINATRLRVGAAALDARVANRAAEHGIAGLEFLRTIPGTIGGAVKMNAGCYGRYAADVVDRVKAIDRSGNERWLCAKDLSFGYRSSKLPKDAVIIEAVLKGTSGSREASETLMADYVARREASQPLDQRSCGSTFRNPAGYSSTGATDDPMDLKAWKLIEDAGCRGLRVGGAQMSEKHANFLVNTGNATAADLEKLGEQVRARVKAASGHDLQWEIQRIGVILGESEPYRSGH